MFELVNLRSLPESAHAKAAAAALAGAACAAFSLERVHVPYFWFRATGSAPTLYGRRPYTIDCLVDALTGEASTSDPFVAVEHAGRRDDVLTDRLPAGEAQKAAERCVANALCRKLRTLADFRIALAGKGLVHKAFWIVPRGHDHVLVDSVTGGWCPLPADSATRAAKVS